MASNAKEIIFINDGSTDRTNEILNEIKFQNPLFPIKVITLDKNQGRFTARLRGAEASNSKFLFFMDTRVSLPADTSTIIASLLSSKHSLMADIKINKDAHKYSLYWYRTHQRIFANALRDRNKSFYINKENFKDNLTGTGALVVSKSIFLKNAYSFDSDSILSDDNALIEKIVVDCPIFFDPSFYVFWEPRKEFLPFVLRMFERGPSFVEYHIFKHRGVYFYIVSLGLLFLMALFFISINHLLAALIALAIVVAAILVSTLAFSHSVKEFIVLAPVHFGTILFFGFGILWGIILNSWKYFKTAGKLGDLDA
jgi:glycosyltransferase involved in cell wall biosynthesis